MDILPIKAVVRNFSKVLIFVLIVQIPLLVFSQYVPHSFFKSRLLSLQIELSSTTLLNLNCSESVTIKTVRGGHANVLQPSDLTVTLTATAGTKFYSDPACIDEITSLTVLTGASSSTFYVATSTIGIKMINGTAAGYRDISADITVSNNPFLWTGSGAPSTDFATGANWFGGAAPGTNDIAVFDGSCVSNCDPTFSADIQIKGLRMNSDYTGSIIQGAHDFHFNGFGLVQEGGTFQGATSSTPEIKLEDGHLVLAGGTFTANTGTWVHRGAFRKVNSPTINFPAGSLFFYDCENNSLCTWPRTFEANGVNFANFDMNSRWDVDFQSTTLRVTEDFTFTRGPGYSSGYLRNGVVEVEGDVTLLEFGMRAENFTIELVGNSSGQTVTGFSTTGAYNKLFPPLKINTGTHPVTLTGEIWLTGIEYASSGTFNTSGATITFQQDAGSGECSQAFSIVPGTITWDADVVFKHCAGTYSLNGGTWNLDGDLTFNGGTWWANAFLNNGTIKLKGDLSLPGKGLSGNSTIEIVGRSAGQTISGWTSVPAIPQASAYDLTFPFLKIDAGTHPVTFQNIVSTRNYEYIGSGTVTTTGSTIHIICANGDSYCGNNNDLGSMSYNNIWISVFGTDIDLGGGTLDINGSLTVESPAWTISRIDNGTINLAGDLIAAYQGMFGDSTIVFDGTGAQIIDGGVGMDIPAAVLEVNKASGSLTMNKALELTNSGQDLHLIQGSLDMAGFNLSINDQLTLDSGTVLDQNGGTLSYGSLSNSGTINP